MKEAYIALNPKNIEPIIERHKDKILGISNFPYGNDKRQSLSLLKVKVPSSINEIKVAIPEISIPKYHPQHLNKFVNTCDAREFRLSKVGNDKKGYLFGYLLYHKAEKDILFVLNYRKFPRLQEKAPKFNAMLINAENIKAPESYLYVMDEAIRFSKEINMKDAFFAFPIKHTELLLATRNDIIGQGIFSRGVHSKPFGLVKIKINH